ncbi:uncharacterized protein LOC123526879 [Mercenaria mercenaria]|uniref:uncharacterized protein LOC123526879 n=1 Tax=Mercenaria mercenaria TaxID=6596 RepID=UPI00234F806E|nr:uncharacterized protein LOC123526879 [Mercenaria mercenaria]XP_053379496.1 uncharacterized protein LOC123526879 [Mercenaria mercenaria]
MMNIKLTCTSVILQLLFIFQVQGQFDPIAFTLGQDSHVNILDVANATQIPFSVVITNHQAASLNSGVFTCSEAGLYKFQVYSLTKSDTNVFLELYVNDKLVASLWGHTPGDYAAAGNAVILPLMSGDFVKVMSRSQYAVNVYGTPDEIYTTFTGVQLGSLELNTEGSKLSAFSVTLNQHQDIIGGQNVLYNNILTDVNGAYDVTSGVYTVPSSGLYIFHFFSLARQNKELYQDLYHNNQYVCSIYGLTDQDWADAGNTVLLHLKQNDEISIRADGNNSLYGAADQIYTTFSGAQLVTDTDMNSGQEKIIAFSVGLSHHATVTSNNKVIFDRIFLDLQHAYNQMSGEFIVPVSGLYEFNYHALGKQNGKIWLELVHNYRYVNSLYSHTPNHYATAGNSAVLDLDAGDVVFVKSHGDVDLYGTDKEVYCTFTGYLLAPISTNNEIVG